MSHFLKFSLLKYFIFPFFSSAISVKTESPEVIAEAPSCNNHAHVRKRSAQPPRPPISRFLNSGASNGQNSKFRGGKDNGKSTSTPIADQQKQTHQKCPNCAIVDSELQLLKTELSVIKQFLGNKLTLMEQKIDNIQVLIK